LSIACGIQNSINDISTSSDAYSFPEGIERNKASRDYGRFNRHHELFSNSRNFHFPFTAFVVNQHQFQQGS
jgi:hypothetical protein